MRQDQFLRLQHLSEKLSDVLIDELNPDNWTGAGIDLRALAAEDEKRAKAIRGDRYWDKKNAAATLSALTRLHTIIGLVQRTAPPPSPEDEPADDIDKEMATAEQEALRAIDEAQRRAKRGRK